MLFYLLYDAPDTSKPYSILTSDGHFSRWLSLSELLATPLCDYLEDHHTPESVANYIINPVYPIIATFDHLPTAESNPELFL